MLLRTISAPSPLAVSLAEVRNPVDDAFLVSVLRHGRPAAMQQSVVELSGVSTEWFEAGAGTPLLFVHGLGHDAWDFAPILAHVGQTEWGKAYKRVTFDVPGFGFSDKPSELRWSLQILVQSLVDALQLAGAATSGGGVVVASSLGGHVAILAALLYPHLFKKLVLLAPGGLVDVGPMLAATLRAHYAVSSILSRSEADIVGTSRRIFADTSHPLCEALAARKLAVHRSARAREFAVPFAGYVDDVFRHVVRDRFERLTVPTLVVSGERDVVVPADACATAARRLGCRFVLMPGVGHTPHLEATAALADLIMTFVGTA